MTALEATAAGASVPSIAGVTPVAPASPPPGTGIARFVGNERTYWRLMVRGALLLLCTLGIYRFWLATDQRRFLWANTEIAGDALEYTGTARELLIGFLIAIAVLVPIYAGFFLAAMDLGIIGRISGVLAFVLLALFGHFAIYRARRYRLTRTVFRGVRLHQTGSAWLYAVYSMGWLAVTLLTAGLAYPWGQATLERYKLRHTFYGDIRGHFAGSGTRLFVRGIALWLVVVGPLLVGAVFAIQGINWSALAEAIERGGDNVIGRIESVSPNFGAVLAFAIMASIWSIIAAALLYPAFQTITLRWWTSGLRFGAMTAKSRLRMGQMYGLYLRFLGYSLVFAIIIGIVSSLVFGLSFMLFKPLVGTQVAEIAGVVGAVASYVVVMLGYSTIYQVTVRLRLWRLSFETAELSGLDQLQHVKAAGAASSAFGEGLADALDVGGL
ncbi:MAG: YjgN family protein [Xanthobacteraceae bacterium]